MRQFFIIHYSLFSFKPLICTTDQANGTKRVENRPLPASFFLPHQKVVFWLFEGKFSFFFHNFYVFSVYSKQSMNFSRNRTNLQSQEALQSSRSPIVLIRHVLIHFILLLQLLSYIVATTLNKWRLSGSLGKKFTTTQSNWCGHLRRIG